MFNPTFLTEKLLACSLIIQSAELLQLREVYSETGIWRWSILRRETTHLPAFLRSFLEVVLSEPGFSLLLVLRLLISSLMLFYSHPVFPPFLLALSILVCYRWRGTFNGGSDYMTLLVLFVLSIAETFARVPAIALIAFYYLGFQTCLSYFLAGVVKVLRPNWRDGSALEGFLASDTYRSDLGNLFIRHPNWPRILSWKIMIFELLAPFALISPVICGIFIFSAFCFHLVNAYVFGLNRFVFAWLASYPSFYFTAVALFFYRHG